MDDFLGTVLALGMLAAMVFWTRKPTATTRAPAPQAVGGGAAAPTPFDADLAGLSGFGGVVPIVSQVVTL